MEYRISLRLLRNSKWPGRTGVLPNDPWSTSKQWRTRKTRMKKSFGSVGVGTWDLIQQIPLANIVWSSDDYCLVRLTPFSLVQIYRPVVDRVEPEDWSNKILRNNYHGVTVTVASHFIGRWVFSTYTCIPQNSLITVGSVLCHVL